MNTPVNFKLAKLLKEKEFGLINDDYIQLPRFYEKNGDYVEYDVYVSKKYSPTRSYLGANTIEDFEAHLMMMDNSLDDIYLAPTIAEVITWLYKNHKIWITVNVSRYGSFYSNILKEENTKSLDNPIEWETKIQLNDFPLPDKAYKAAIKYSLNKLI